MSHGAWDCGRQMGLYRTRSRDSGGRRDAVMDILRVDGVTPLDVAFLALFSILSLWNSISFWISCAGAYAQWRKKATSTIKWPPEWTRRSMLRHRAQPS